MTSKDSQSDQHLHDLPVESDQVGDALFEEPDGGARGFTGDRPPGMPLLGIVTGTILSLAFWVAVGLVVNSLT